MANLASRHMEIITEFIAKAALRFAVLISNLIQLGYIAIGGAGVTAGFSLFVRKRWREYRSLTCGVG